MVKLEKLYANHNCDINDDMMREFIRSITDNSEQNDNDNNLINDNNVKKSLLQIIDVENNYLTEQLISPIYDLLNSPFIQINKINLKHNEMTENEIKKIILESIQQQKLIV